MSHQNNLVYSDAALNENQKELAAYIDKDGAKDTPTVVSIEDETDGISQVFLFYI